MFGQSRVSIDREFVRAFQSYSNASYRVYLYLSLYQLLPLDPWVSLDLFSIFIWMPNSPEFFTNGLV